MVICHSKIFKFEKCHFKIRIHQNATLNLENSEFCRSTKIPSPSFRPSLRSLSLCVRKPAKSRWFSFSPPLSSKRLIRCDFFLSSTVKLVNLASLTLSRCFCQKISIVLGFLTKSPLSKRKFDLWSGSFFLKKNLHCQTGNPKIDYLDRNFLKSYLNLI